MESLQIRRHIDHQFLHYTNFITEQNCGFVHSHELVRWVGYYLATLISWNDSSGTTEHWKL